MYRLVVSVVVVENECRSVLVLEFRRIVKTWLSAAVGYLPDGNGFEGIVYNNGCGGRKRRRARSAAGKKENLSKTP